jgi:hypothetical protein
VAGDRCDKEVEVRRILLIVASLALLLMPIVACEPASEPKPHPPPEGYSSWDEYYDEYYKETSPPAPPPASPEPLTATEVVTIDIGWPMPENWDADPEIDGIEFDLTPKDAEDEMVSTSGVVSAKLWLESLWEGSKGDLVQEWSNIQVTKDDYDWLWGATIRLEYRGFEPQEMQFGILEVTLVTPDGKSFTARAKDVLLGE